MKLYKDCYRTATITVPELNRRDPITNKVVEIYNNIEVKIKDYSLSYTDEPTFKFTFCIRYIDFEGNLFTNSFKFDFSIKDIHIELLNCRVDCISTTIELSCMTSVITGFDVTEDILVQLIA